MVKEMIKKNSDNFLSQSEVKPKQLSIAADNRSKTNQASPLAGKGTMG